jgi:two-component system sensor histidine kinase PilS (NtrC family)
MPIAVSSTSAEASAERAPGVGIDHGGISRWAAGEPWRPLIYFAAYRLLLASVLLAGVLGAVESFSLGFPTGVSRGKVSGLLLGYWGLSLASFLGVWRFRRSFDFHLTAQVVVDVIVFSTMIYLSGGLRSGFGVMLLVTLAGASLVGQGRLTLFYAALATIGVLGQETIQSVAAGVEPSDFLLAGILCLGFFVTAGTVRVLARRLVANEELARRRGVALRRQMQVSEAVISLMQDGVLVVTGSGLIQQANPRARGLIGAGESAGDALSEVSPVLADSFSAWMGGDLTSASCEFRARGTGLQLLARFVHVDGEGDDSLVFVEDAGRANAEAQKVKLAALGRLTASIAHEIRNPLSAIRHASELLGETLPAEQDQRLIRIVADNTRRLDGIVSDVLQLGRRDRAQRETIELSPFVAGFVDQFVRQSGVPRAIVRIAVDAAETIEFDRSHLHQILWNLCSNALRHCCQEDGSIRIWSESGESWCALHVADDGGGVSDDQRASVFEPFYTTHAKGTGLGLFIARELADANSARLELLDNSPGGHFSIVGERKA